MSMIERPLPYFTRIAYPVLRRLVLEHGRAHLWGYALAFVFMALVAASTTYSAYLLKQHHQRADDRARFSRRCASSPSRSPGFTSSRASRPTGRS